MGLDQLNEVINRGYAAGLLLVIVILQTIILVNQRMPSKNKHK